MLADSGCTGHYLQPALSDLLQPADAPLITITMPNGTRLTSTGACSIPLPAVSEPAKLGHIVPGLATSSLLSIGKLCDDGCQATFTASGVTISKNGML